MRYGSILFRLVEWFWSTRLGKWLSDKQSVRCEVCPLCAVDYSDFPFTGCTQAYCTLHQGNEAQGCFTPGFIIRIIAAHRQKGYERSCRICGCTQHISCPGGCYWVEYDLCSRCAAILSEDRNAKTFNQRPPQL